jgi:tetratricopeptide (TPR) repeat protein
MAYSNLGASLWEGGNLDQALAYLERAIEIQPDLGNAYYNLGLVQLGSGDLVGAEASLQQAAALTPAPEPHFHLGRLYLQQRQFPAAIAAFESALERFPNYVEAHYNLGVARYSRRRLRSGPGILSHRHRPQPQLHQRLLQRWASLHSTARLCGSAGGAKLRQKPLHHPGQSPVGCEYPSAARSH